MLVDISASAWRNDWHASPKTFHIAEINIPSAVSLLVWSELFTGASQQHVFADNALGIKPRFKRSNQTGADKFESHSYNDLQEVLEGAGGDFYLVLDAASTLPQRLQSFNNFQKHLATNGVYVMEGVDFDEAVTLRHLLSAAN
eukprot:4683598-Amphidinium_carterae.3